MTSIQILFWATANEQTDDRGCNQPHLHQSTSSCIFFLFVIKIRVKSGKLTR